MIPGDEPPGDELERPPITLGFCLLIALTVSVMMSLTIITVLSFGIGRAGGAVGIGVVVGFGAGFALVVPRLDGAPADVLGFRAARLPVWIGSVLLLSSLLLSSELDNLLRMLSPVESPDVEPPQGFAARLELFLAVVIAMPLAQEFLFRGALLPPVVEKLGRFRGVIFTALLSALVFVVPSGGYVANHFVNAGILGYVRVSGGSLLPCLLLHLLTGLTAYLATYQAFGVPGFDDLSTPHTPFEYLAPAALLTGIGLRLCRAGEPEPPYEPPSPDEPL